MAKKRNLGVIVLAGMVPIMENEALRKCFDVLMAIGSGPMDVDTAMELTKENLVRMGTEIGNLLALRK